MKSDSSRNTFDPHKHFSSVRMQQGRVQVDADSNEQIDIVNHHAKVEGKDVIGACGAPMHYPAFHIVADLTPGPEANVSHLSDEEIKLPENKPVPQGYKVPDFLISAGRYYVDGILCENDHLTSYLNQPDLPGAVAIKDAGWYLVYVDVWRRLLTALDDSAIREIALGGPDTATREKTVWQVKYLPLKGAANCASDIADYTNLIAPSSAQMSARTKPAQTPQNPCIVPPGAGYTGLENQFYRVEIHDGGDPVNVKTSGAGNLATLVPNHSNQISTTGAWQKGQALEIFSNKAGDDPMNGTLAYITEDPVTNAGKKILTLDIDVSQIAIDELHVRTTVKSTFKWSRDNGTVATSILNITGKDVTVHDLGRDDVLGFKPGQWVEISDDLLELNGLPGQLAEITFVDTAINKITLNTTPTLVVNPNRHPKLRRWDGIGAVKFHPDNPADHFIDLESGIQIRFFDGKYATGDYWYFPARTATADTQSGNIEWPTSGNDALPQSPFGIKHHYCRLAILHWDGTKFVAIQDCRNLFPPITELTNMFYEGGDGQEAMPGEPLPQPLQVAVFNGRWPVANASVRFSVSSAKGTFAPNANQANLDKGHLATTFPPTPANPQTLVTTTGPDGIASCYWLLDDEFDAGNNRFTRPSQQVEACLLDADGKVTPATVRFDGNLSIAEKVFYNPGDCKPFEQDKTVQKAVDRLAHLISLYEVSGNNQEIMPGGALPQPLVVLAANRCGPITDKTQVQFSVISGGGNVTPINGGITDTDGKASCTWQPGPNDINQEVQALIVSDASHATTAPTSVRFTCTLSVAKNVAYDPAKCKGLRDDNVTNVQDAIDHLCQAHQGGGCDVTVGKGGQFETLDQAIEELLKKENDICICLLAGDHELPRDVIIQGQRKERVKIVGCGRGTRLRFSSTAPGGGAINTFAALGLTSFILRDVEVRGDNLRIEILDCDTVALESCYLRQTNQTIPFINIARAATVRFVANVVDTQLPAAPGGATGRAGQLFANVPDVPGLFTLSDAEFQSKSLAAASKLASQPEAVRGSMVTQVQSGMRTLGVSGTQAKAVQGFLRAMSGSAADPAAIQASLVDVKAAFQTPGVALVIADAEADTWIADNDINGVVCLYGLPGNDALTQDQMSKISLALKAPSVSRLEFVDSQSQLQITHNTLYRLGISGKLADALRTVSPSVKTSLPGLYRRSFISDNEFLGGNNVFVMEHLALESNSFEQEDKADAGNAVVQTGIYVGNFAPHDIRLFNAAPPPANQKAANLIINIIDV